MLKGDVLEARGLPPGCRPSVKVLYVEPGDGANMMFRCKTAVHETDAAATVAQAAGEDTVEWRRGEFSFENNDLSFPSFNFPQARAAQVTSVRPCCRSDRIARHVEVFP